jgi:ketosteroid isomerase-like protein
MRGTLVAIVVGLLSTCGAARGATLSADRNDAAEAEIKALELHLAKLLVERNIDEYEKYLSTDYSRINATGTVESREEVLKGFRASSAGGAMEPTELEVDVYGDTAILTGKLAVTTAAGAVRHSRFRKVFIRRGGRWFLVSLQGVTLPDAR